jgi:hypothetical protein
MAGVNQIIKKDQVIFRAGDQSNGMYLIRKGELCVYLEKEGKELILAKISDGGMIGEMALFDNKPRSASVRAVKESEVTLISNEDFVKLMKQIPKWFVSLMTALSTRLRQTNERLKNVENALPQSRNPLRPVSDENSSNQKPFQRVIRILNILHLIWMKNGEKDGKDWIIGRMATESLLIESFFEDQQFVKEFIEFLIKNRVITNRTDSYKNVALVAQNRAQISQLAQFILQFTKLSPQKPFLSEGALAILRTLDPIAQKSPYESCTVSLSELKKHAVKSGVSSETWEQDIAVFGHCGEEVKLVKTSAGPGLKTTKKDCATALNNHEILIALVQANFM